jgi:LPXTG-motif cell wall-anchored protein
VTWSGSVNLPARVVTRTYHPSKGVYVSVPQTGTPGWAILLMVLGGLILLALLAVLILRRRGPGHSPATYGER